MDSLGCTCANRTTELAPPTDGIRGLLLHDFLKPEPGHLVDLGLAQVCRRFRASSLGSEPRQNDQQGATSDARDESLQAHLFEIEEDAESRE